MSSPSLPPPGPHDHVSPDDPRAVWPYDPSFAAALLFLALFGVSTILHTVQMFRYRKWISWVIIMSALWQVVGFVLRVLSTRHQLNKGYYSALQIVILLAPLWTNAFCYICLGRMIGYFVPDRKLIGIRAARFSWLWICLDFVAFVVQAIGGGMAANTGHTASDAREVQNGLHVYMGGIALQQFFILLFLFIAYNFQRKVSRAPASQVPPYKWRHLLYGLYGALVLITIRIIYRLVEFSGKNLTKGFVPSHEVFYYCFDALPMLLAIWIFHVVHPGRYLVPEGRRDNAQAASRRSESTLEKRDAEMHQAAPKAQ
ncbi:RTA1-domain-containing protein [Punctularia strigosozonata HHB-11173 SS5]|uniref:RTA1-domain-containing protein n=1 Tax=Punctularia strigosozonata (strain HHB-11173) TaxID=741275 RepID=UPI0004416A9A|nr:RTA1-domain-containing protein [Punctularia strigosozonata HHB-11173 SS5]EIN12916.1 RTA1-domain-containing protein [Punctularia strigosozonata HHB-11173 SS5]